MTKIKLNKYKNMLSTNQDSYMGLDFSHSNKELPYNDIVKDIDANDVYFNEMDASNKYRISFTINGLISNVLTAITGSDSLQTFSENSFLDENSPLNASLNIKTKISYRESIDKHLKNEQGWLGYYKPNGLSVDCNLIELNPKKKDLNFVNINNFNNWNFNLFYLQDKKQIFSNHSGLTISQYETVDYGGRILYRLFTPFKHNLQRGDKVSLYNIGSGSGKYIVLDIGDDQNESKENMFVVDLPNAPILNSNSNLKRNVNGIDSEYYARLLKKLDGKNSLTNRSYSLFQMGFSNNIFGDSITQLVYNVDIDTTDIVDYLGRPITEIILGIFKNKASNNNSTLFTPIQSGYNLNYNKFSSNLIADIRRLDGRVLTNVNIPLEHDIQYNSDGLIYDYVEFNRFEFKEYILADVYHRFNLTNRVPAIEQIIQTGQFEYTAMGIRKEGYMYKPYHSIKILEESDYVELGDAFDLLPSYAYEYEPNKYKWRDIFDKSKSNISLPFLNGCHYIQKNLDFMVMRQDPFGDYGLLYTKFPKDKFGRSNPFKNNFIKQNSDNDEC